VIHITATPAVSASPRQIAGTITACSAAGVQVQEGEDPIPTSRRVAGLLNQKISFAVIPAP
jgi:hypothetical protein